VFIYSLLSILVGESDNRKGVVPLYRSQCPHCGLCPVHWQSEFHVENVKNQ
jgi:hypothetical protein